MVKKMIITMACLACLQVKASALTKISPAFTDNSQTHEIFYQDKKIEGEVLEFQDKLLVPLRKVGESLGFSFIWNKENRSIVMDNQTVASTLYIGKDSYFKQSSQALGLTKPVELGVAPLIIGNRTYVPVEFFELLDPALKLSITKTTAQIPNPFVDYDNLEELQKQSKFAFKMPKYMPENFTQAYFSGFNTNDLAQITYTNTKGDSITYRVSQEKNDNLSGDYNNYEQVVNENINNFDVQFKGNGKNISSVNFNDGNLYYSLLFSNPIGIDEVKKIIDSIQ